MNTLDFEYDGRCLSDFGFIICSFDDNSGVITESAGSEITFNKVSRNGGKRYSLSSTQYDGCVEATFSICKNPCLFDDMAITDDEYRLLVRWLNREEFRKFRLIIDDPSYTQRYYNGSFNISKVKVADILYGLELTLETDKPFAYAARKTITLDFSDTSASNVVTDTSDKIGYIYPDITITCASSGDLAIYNKTLDSATVVKNCTAGEVITMNGDTLIIATSDTTHDICNDFNYEFFKIGNSYTNRENEITASLPCQIELRYYPIIKDSP